MTRHRPSANDSAAPATHDGGPSATDAAEAWLGRIAPRAAAVAAPILAVLAVAVWWSGRNLAAHAGDAWLFEWRQPNARGVVGLALPVAAGLVAAAALGTWQAWRLSGIPDAGSRALRSMAWFTAIPFVLLYDDPQGRGALAAAAACAFCWLAAPRRGGADDAPSEAGGVRWHVVIAVVSTIAMGWVATQRYRAHWASLIDLGLLYELYDNPSGELLFAPTLGFSFLGEHFSLILVLLWPIVAVFRSPISLLWIQAAAVGVGGLVLHRLVVHRVGDHGLALAMMVAWFVNPWIQKAVLYDFHMDMLESPFLFGAALAMYCRRDAWLWVCCVALWCTKEDTFLYTSTIALFVAFELRRPKLAALLFGVGLLQAAIVFGVVLPALRPPNDPAFFSTTGSTEQYAFLTRYSHLGDSLSEIVKNVALNPFGWVGHLLSGRRLTSIVALLAGFGGLALVGRWGLIWLVPCLEMLLANPGRMSHLEFYYGAVVLPFAVLASIEGARRFRRSGTRVRVTAAVAVVAGSSALALTLPWSWLAPESAYPSFGTFERQAEIDAALEQIPEGARVSATGYLAVTLMSGRDVAMIPYRLDDAEWLVVDLQRPAWPSEPRTVQAHLRTMIDSGSWELLAADNLFFVARRLETPLSQDGLQAARAALLNAFTTFTLEAEQTELTHYLGAVRRDDSASDGAYLRVAASDARGAAHAHWGPYLNVPPGRYTVAFALRWRQGGRDATPDVPIAPLDVRFDRPEVVVVRDVLPAELSATAWTHISLDVEIPDDAARCEPRVYYPDMGTLDIDAIHWAPVTETGAP